MARASTTSASTATKCRSSLTNRMRPSSARRTRYTRRRRHDLRQRPAAGTQLGSRCAIGGAGYGGGARGRDAHGQAAGCGGSGPRRRRNRRGGHGGGTQHRRRPGRGRGRGVERAPPGSGSKRVGIADRFAEFGPYAALLDRYGMAVADIVAAVQQVVARKTGARKVFAYTANPAYPRREHDEAWHRHLLLYVGYRL